MKNADEPKILLDADVIRHFLRGGQIQVLAKIFPKRFVLLDIVKNELCRSKSLQTPVNNFIEYFKIEVCTFSRASDVVKEYALLKSTGKGIGESACLATARYEKKYIASSNLNDIKVYCELHEIKYYTTMDLLEEAMNKGILTEANCDEFIYNVKSKGSILPCNTMQEYFTKIKKKAV